MLLLEIFPTSTDHWQLHMQALRKTFFLGINVIGVLIHMYEHLKGPVYYPYFEEQSEFVKPDMNSHNTIGDVAIPVKVITFAIIVFIQRQCGLRKYL